MAIDDKLKQRAVTVEEFLARELEPSTCAHAAATPDRLREAMRHGVLGAGKRFRPFLVIETASMLGASDIASVPVAAALECIHCYSLVHDDLPSMDNDTLRRGQPTVWAKFDDWTAILAGDALLTLAFEIAGRDETHPDPAIRCRVVSALASASGRAGMVGGQCLDLEADKLADPRARDAAHIRRLQSMKTGALIRVACELGGLIGGASPQQMDALSRFGDGLGFAFQIADDLLDAEGDPAMVGKATGKDLAIGKATLVATLGIDGAREKLHHVHSETVATLSEFGTAADTLRQAADFAVARLH
ncbi:MAG: polyprenyl synthetase family protein [Hyphomicrobiaceae bacterium]|nr:polyprenyl synthetase family protein [Hyphomicrobiaceae bacterium]